MKEIMRTSETFEFSTGKTFYAYNGIIGLSGENGDFFITYGYDGEVDTKSFTNDEFTELADYMINKWKLFKKSLKQ